MFVDGMGPCNKSGMDGSWKCTFLNTCSAHQREILQWQAQGLGSLAFATFSIKNTAFQRTSKAKAKDLESLWTQMARRQANGR